MGDVAVAEAPAAPTLADLGGAPPVVEEEAITDITEAVPRVLKNALKHDGLVRGIHEVAKALDAKRVICCFLAQSCTEEPYTALIEALCKEGHVPLIKVPDAAELGKWAGLCKLDKDGNPRKIVGAAAVGITDFGEDSPALTYLKKHMPTM